MKFIDPAEVLPETVKNREDMEEWWAQPCAYTWEELSEAAEGLDPTKQPLRRKRRPSAEAGFDVRGAQTLLINTSKLEVYKEKFTEENCKNFERAVKRVRQELDLHKYYLSNTKIIKHYSSVARVKEKIPQFDLIQDWEVEMLVQNGNHTADSLKLVEDSTFIKQKFISEDATFTKKKFHFLTSFKIAAGLENYFSSVPNLSFWRKEEAIDSYNEIISQEHEREKEQYKKKMKTLPFGFYTPIHFLVCQEMDKGYRIQEPFVELTKLRAYFGGLLKMPKVRSLDPWRAKEYHPVLKHAARRRGVDLMQEVESEDEESPHMQEVESEDEESPHMQEVESEDEEPPPMQEVESEDEEPPPMQEVESEDEEPISEVDFEEES